MSDETLYEVLSVDQSASQGEVRTAYRLLAMKWHPSHGSHSGAAAKFQNISLAYAILSRAEKRARYDQELLKSVGQRTNIGEQVSDGHAARMFLGEMSDLASELSELGYEREFIERALSEEGCPAQIVAAVIGDFKYEGGPENLQNPQPVSGAWQTDVRIPPTAVGQYKVRRSAWPYLLLAVAIGLSSYFFVYRPYVAVQEEEARRIQAEIERAEEIVARKAAEEQARAAEERAWFAEQRAREEETKRSFEQQERTHKSQAQQQELTRERLAQRQAAARDAAARRDAAELARLERLRVQCEGVMRAKPGPFTSIAGMQLCGPYYQALKQREYYEQLRRR